MSLEDDSTSDLRALAHPLRLEMLSLLTATELSAAEVARELGTTQANASYHLRVLLEAGLLVVAGEEKVNGGLAKKYRHPWDAPPPPRASSADRETAAEVQTMAHAATRRFARRQPGTRMLFTDADLWVEPQVWDEVVALLAQASQLVHASAKPPRTSGTVRGSVSVMAFQTKDEARP